MGKTKSINLKFQKMIKTFNILTNQCHYIVSSVQRIQKAKIQKLQR